MAVLETGTDLLYGSLPAGLPCWIDLRTPDLPAAEDFYHRLFGWEYHQEDGYTLALLDGYPVAGLCPSQDSAPAWTLYLAADDVERTSERVRETGGRLLRPSAEVPGVGLRAVARDPHLAEFGFLRASRSWQFHVGVPGSLMWGELITTGPRTADEFYGDLFDFRVDQHGRGATADFAVWYSGGESVLARVRMVPDVVRTKPHWLIYLGVRPEDGVDEVLRRAVTAGAEVRVDPFDGSYGRVAVIRDTAGARVALLDQTRAVGWGQDHDPYDD
ncbi:VOC family protein [Actinoalloteichus caeruleus]|uniref:VOC family protein n=1 Tax=Actinoalloteichus cyanogriseus TaxID=2893586 RepID=UPI00068B5A3B|nr:VOC family protein [Actinoalloteichus caeruleus]